MANHSGHAGPHVVPKRIYFLVFFALILLTWVTTGISTVDLGRCEHFRGACHRDLQGIARGAVLHARLVQHAD